MLIRNNVLFIWASVATSYTDRAPQVAENSEVDSPPPPCGELLCIHATSGGMDTFVGNIAISMKNLIDVEKSNKPKAPLF